MGYDLMMLDGDQLLKRMDSSDSTRIVCCDEEMILSTNEYPESALLHQLKEQLSKDNPAFVPDRSSFEHILLYIDFSAAFPMEDKTPFDRLFLNGVAMYFPDVTVLPHRYVPFISSQSQSKKHIYVFIREDLFSAMKERLDLGMSLEEGARKKLQTLTKMYAYRALYTSAATPLFHGRDDGADAFFNDENIIILDDVHRTSQNAISVFSTEMAEETDTGEIVMSPKTKETKIELNCFDGMGIISPAARKLFNDHLPKSMRGNSFQVRMPYFKGVLHTVNLYCFLRKNGVTAEHAYVKDVFGRERDLLKANVVVTTSIFKLYGLLSEDESKDKDFMRRYFESIRKYNHGLYIVKTEASFHSTQYVRLNSQLMSTLCLSAEELDELVQSHLDLADAFCADNLTDAASRERLFAIADRSDWMDLLLKEPRFIHDPFIRSMLDNYRIARYNDIALGRLRVRGENRFLSGDLFYFLICLLIMVSETQPHLKEQCDKLSKRCIRSGAVYIPHAIEEAKEVALFRNPHLSRNEDVCTKMAKGRYYYYYDEYLGHLSGVAIVGHRSCIPAALGGADFDGDHIGIVYDKRVIDAYRRGGYVEIWGEPNNAPLIDIPPLHGGNSVQGYTYISPQAVYNTFSNRIGIISDAAMRIAAVEYDCHVADPDYSAALCTVLTGNEIDATKKGVRPHIDDVINYRGRDDQQQARIVSEVQVFIDAKKVIKSNRNKKPSVKENGETLTATTIGMKSITLHANRECTAIPQLLYRWANAFVHFTDSKRRKSPKGILEGIFDEKYVNSEQVHTILCAYEEIRKQYASLQKERRAIELATENNRAKSCVRLKEQYDDVFMSTDGKASVWSCFQRLQSEAYSLLDHYTAEQFKDLFDSLFSEATDKFEPSTFWPYGGEPTDMSLYESLMNLPHADLLKNFDCEGYRLLYYVLDNVIRSAGAVPTTVCNSGNPYALKYHSFYRQSVSKALSSTAFEKQLAKIARDDLYAALVTNDTSDLIRSIYPHLNSDLRTAFWKIFTIGEVLTAVGGDDDAQ